LENVGLGYWTSALSSGQTFFSSIRQADRFCPSDDVSHDAERAGNRSGPDVGPRLCRPAEGWM